MKSEDKEAFRICRATEKDLPVLLELIREMALCERVTDLTVDREKLLQTLFRRPLGTAFLAWCGEEPAGFTLVSPVLAAYRGQASLLVDSIFVRTAFRRRGLGHRLMSRLARFAEEESCSGLEWALYKWNEAAREFYQHLGATCLDWDMMRLDGEELASLRASEQAAER